MLDRAPGRRHLLRLRRERIDRRHVLRDTHDADIGAAGRHGDLHRALQGHDHAHAGVPVHRRRLLRDDPQHGRRQRRGRGDGRRHAQRRRRHGHPVGLDLGARPVEPGPAFRLRGGHGGIPSRDEPGRQGLLAAGDGRLRHASGAALGRPDRRRRVGRAQGEPRRRRVLRSQPGFLDFLAPRGLGLRRAADGLSAEDAAGHPPDPGPRLVFLAPDGLPAAQPAGDLALVGSDVVRGPADGLSAEDAAGHPPGDGALVVRRGRRTDRRPDRRRRVGRAASRAHRLRVVRDLPRCLDLISPRLDLRHARHDDAPGPPHRHPVFLSRRAQHQRGGGQPRGRRGDRQQHAREDFRPRRGAAPGDRGDLEDHPPLHL